MATPDVATMKRWLRDVLEAEKATLVTSAALKELRAQRSAATSRRSFSAPTKPEKYSVFQAIIASVIAGAYGSFWPSIVTIVICFFGRSINGFSRVVEIFLVWTLGIGIGYYFYIKSTADKELAEYKQELAIYENNVAKEERRLRHAQTKIVPQIEKEIASYNSLLARLSKTRTDLYSTNFLAAQYESLIPVATMLGYLETGRCTTVYGHGGIIDTYIHDQQFQVLNGKLDTIIERLDDIRYSQVVLYNAIKESQSTQSKLIKEIRTAASTLHSDNLQLAANNQYISDVVTWVAAMQTYGWR